MLRSASTLAVVGALALAPAASAEAPVLHATAGAARALGGAQQSETGLGGGGSLALELPLARALGVEIELGGVALTAGSAPADPTLAPRGASSALTATAGLRLHPWGSARSGPWLDAHGGGARTGGLTRAAFDARMGWDFQVGALALGPFVGYLHVLQPDDTLRPDDAHVALAGLHASLGAQPPPPPAAPPASEPVLAAAACADPRSPGCPEADRDGDGIVDARDACPDAAEDRDGFQDDDGCPDPDNDGDGFTDDVDRCPLEPENFNGYADDDGCPDEPQVRVTGDTIVLDERLHFGTDDAGVRAQSFPLVRRLAKLLAEHPEYLRIELDGHADRRGDELYNLHLSERRARAVRRLLVSWGVQPDRLVVRGHGMAAPREAGGTRDALAANRRVEFTIVRADASAPPPPPLKEDAR